jgi:hypothetical protein
VDVCKQKDSGGGKQFTAKKGAMNNEQNTAFHGAEQWAAFQNIWTETLTKMMQLGISASPESTPPELLRQIRSGIFQALSHSWDEFLRSPQFLESMKQWMESAIAFRKMTNDFLTKARHETQTPARDDIDAAMLTVRHMETRILDRLEAVGAHVKQLQEQVDALSKSVQVPKKRERKPSTERSRHERKR